MADALTLPRIERPEATTRLDADAAVVDDPELQRGFMTWETAAEGHRLGRTQLHLAGLSCAGCAAAVERALRAEPGVVEASASYGTQRASVLWDPSRTRLSALLAAVRRAGYDAAPDAAAPARAMRKSRGAQGALAALRRRLLHDAGDDVPGAALSGGARRDERRPAQAAAVGGLAPQHSGRRVLGGADVPRSVGGPAPAPHRHGPAGLDRHRPHVRRQHRRDVRARPAVRQRAVVRLADDVRQLPPGRALARPQDAQPGRCFARGRAVASAGRGSRRRRRRRDDAGAAASTPARRPRAGAGGRGVSRPTAACSKATPRSTRRFSPASPGRFRATAATKRSPEASTCAPRSCSAPSASAPTPATKESSV